jgi:hypothetical protein
VPMALYLAAHALSYARRDPDDEASR